MVSNEKESKTTIIKPPHIFDHISDINPKVNQMSGFSEIMDNNGGICWAASCAMAISSVTGRDSFEVLSKINNLMFDRNALSEYFSDFVKNQNDPTEDLKEFIQRMNTYPLVSTETGGLETMYFQRFPVYTTRWLNFLLRKIDIDDVELRHEQFTNETLKSMSPTKVPVVGIIIRKFLNKHHEPIESGHMVFISGVKLYNDKISEIEINDSRLQRLSKLTQDEDTPDRFINGQYTFEYMVDGNSIGTVSYEPVDVIWIEKKYN